MDAFKAQVTEHRCRINLIKYETVIANEELEASPEIVWGKVTRVFNLPIASTKEELKMQIGNFIKIRVNPQVANESSIKERERHSVPIAAYSAGMYVGIYIYT